MRGLEIGVDLLRVEGVGVKVQGLGGGNEEATQREEDICKGLKDYNSSLRAKAKG